MVKKNCRKVQPPEQGAPTSQTTDRQTDRQQTDRQTDRQTDGRPIAYSERNVVRSLKIDGALLSLVFIIPGIFRNLPPPNIFPKDRGSNLYYIANCRYEKTQVPSLTLQAVGPISRFEGSKSVIGQASTRTLLGSLRCFPMPLVGLRDTFTNTPPRSASHSFKNPQNQDVL